MVQQLNQSLQFEGSAEEQALAGEIWNLLRMQGFSYAAKRPIRQTLTNLAQYMAERKYQGIETAEELAPLIDQALSANPKIFGREENEEIITFATTKEGVSPNTVSVVDHHSFRTRLYEGARAVEIVTPEEQAAAQQAAADYAAVNRLQLPVAANTPGAVTPGTSAPVVAAATAKPNMAAPITRETTKQAGVVPSIKKREELVEAGLAPTETAQELEQVAEQTAGPVLEQTVGQAATQATEQAATTESVVATVSPSATETVRTEAARMVELAPNLEVDLAQPTNQLLADYGTYFRNSLLKAISSDSRFVNFAHEWFLEDATNRYSKGELRRIRDYILDIGGPVTDGDIMSGVFNKRPNDGDYVSTRFSLNYRLGKEKKDFEFVGTADERIWTTAGVPAIGQTRYKASEIGTDYKYLEDTTLLDSSEVTGEPGKYVWEHDLTFYEYENGVLPYDASAKTIFPKPLMEDQKSVILRFEAVQLGVTYTAELRYPSGNRGGWIVGLEGFFSDNLVPGAVLVIRQSGKTNHFTIEYKQGDEQEARLLFWDERRQKFVFRPIIFACTINKDDALMPDRYARIDGQKRMDESDRKRTDFVLTTAFEYVGQRQGQDTYYALLDDLYPIANIERPFSRAYLRSLLTSGNSQFKPDETTPEAFYYKIAGQGRR
jgi:hypothetical protein